jgi:hypothetical protein
MWPKPYITGAGWPIDETKRYRAVEQKTLSSP